MNNETIADILREIRQVNPHNEIADRIEAAHKRELTTTKESLAVGNSAKTREALEDAEKTLSDSSRSLYGIPPHLHKLLARIRAALSEPPRNCDRFDGDIDLLREACLRERGLNPEEDFPKVFCEWLLEPAKEEERVKILKILTNGKTKGANDGK